MSVSIGTIEGLLKLTDQFTEPMRRAASALENSSKQMVGQLANIAGGYISIRAATSFLSAAVAESREWTLAMGQVEQRIKSTGGAAGVTSGMVSQLSAQIQSTTRFTDDQTASAAALGLTFKRIGSEDFPTFIRFSADLAQVMGGDLDGATKMLGKSLNDAEGDVTQIAKATGAFSDALQAQIKDLVQSGERGAANALIFKELERTIGGAGAAGQDSLNKLSDASADALQSVGDGLVPAVNKLAESLGEVASNEETLTFLKHLGEVIGMSLELLDKLISGLQLLGKLDVGVGKWMDLMASGGFFGKEADAAMVKANEAAFAASAQHLAQGAQEFGKQVLSAEQLAFWETMNARDSKLAADAAEKQRAAAEAIAEAMAAAFKKGSADVSAFSAGVSALLSGKTVSYAEALVDAMQQFPGASNKTITSLVSLSVRAKTASDSFALLKQFIEKTGKGVDLSGLDAVIKETKASSHQFWLESLTDTERFAVNVEAAKKAMKALGFSTAEIEKWLIQNGRLVADITEEIVQAGSAQDHLNQLVEMQRDLADNVWVSYVKAASSAFSAVESSIGTAISDGLKEGSVDGEAIMKSLVDNLIDIFADMVAEIVTNWLKGELLKTAITMKQAAIRKSIDSASKSGGGGGGGGTAGTVSQAGSAYQSGSSAGMSANTMAGYALVAYALFVVYKGFIEDHKRKFSGVTLGDQGQITSTFGHTQKYLQGVQEAAASIVKSLREWMKSVNVELTSFGSISIEHDKSGWSVSGAGGYRMFFKTAEEAISAAQAMMVRFGEFAQGVPALVQSAVRATRDMNMDAINSNIEFARTLITQNMEDVALAMQDATDLFVDQIRRSFDLFAAAGSRISQMDLGALNEATASSILHFTNSLQSLYNQLTGHREDPKEAAERQRVAYNLQRTIIIAQIMLLYEEIKARVAAVQAQIALISVLHEAGAGMGGGLNPYGTGGRPVSARPTGNTKGGGMLTIDERNPSNNPQLAALLQILDNLARALGSVPGEIGPGGVVVGGRGGGQRAARKESQADIRREAGMFGMSDISRQMVESGHWLDDFKKKIKEAGFSAAESASLIAQATAEMARRQEEVRKGVSDRVNEFLGVGQDPIAQLGKNMQQLLKDITDAGFPAAEAARMVAALTAEYEKQAALLVQQGRDAAMQPHQGALDAAAGIGSHQRELIDAIMGIEKSREALRKLAEEASAAGRSTDFLAGDLARLDAAQSAAARNIGFEFLGSLEALGVSLPTEVVLELAHAQFLLAQAQAMSAALALAAAGAFDGLSFSLDDLLGWITGADFDASTFFPQTQAPVERFTETVNDAANALSDLARRLVDAQGGIRDLLVEMAGGQHGVVTSRQAMEFQEERYQSTLAMARTGDIGALESIDDIGRDLLASLANFSPSLLAAQFPGIQADMEGLLGITTAHEGNLLTSTLFTQSHQQQIEATNTGFRATVAVGTEQVSRMETMIDELGTIASNQQILNDRLQMIETHVLTTKRTVMDNG